MNPGYHSLMYITPVTPRSRSNARLYPETQRNVVSYRILQANSAEIYKKEPTNSSLETLSDAVVVKVTKYFECI